MILGVGSRIYRRLPRPSPRINRTHGQCTADDRTGRSGHEGVTMIRRRLTNSAVLGLALAALAAPAASARPLAERTFGSPDARDRAIAAERYQDLRSPDTRDYAEGRGTFNAPEVTVVRIPQAAPSTPATGLDWGDVGIGGAFAVALGLLGASAALLVIRRTAVRRSVTSRTA